MYNGGAVKGAAVENESRTLKRKEKVCFQSTLEGRRGLISSEAMSQIIPEGTSGGCKGARTLLVLVYSRKPELVLKHASSGKGEQRSRSYFCNVQETRCLWTYI